MTDRRFLLILVLLLAGVLAACGGGGGSASANTNVGPRATDTPSGDTAAGKMLFTQSCSACHGPDGKGLPGLGKDMTTSDFIHGMDDQELLAFVKVGRSTSDPANTTGVDMPPKGGNPALTDEQILDIIAYIRNLE